jgi:sulfopyruvate decarboxylase TPP-binding subunit
VVSLVPRLDCYVFGGDKKATVDAPAGKGKSIIAHLSLYQMASIAITMLTSQRNSLKRGIP